MKGENMKLNERFEQIIEGRVFENENMKDLNMKIQELETEFKRKYSREILEDYLEITELMLEEFILGSELYFEFGIELMKECQKLAELK